MKFTIQPSPPTSMSSFIWRDSSWKRSLSVAVGQISAKLLSCSQVLVTQHDQSWTGQFEPKNIDLDSLFHGSKSIDTTTSVSSLFFSFALPVTFCLIDSSVSQCSTFNTDSAISIQVRVGCTVDRTKLEDDEWLAYAVPNLQKIVSFEWIFVCPLKILDMVNR